MRPLTNNPQGLNQGVGQPIQSGGNQQYGPNGQQSGSTQQGANGQIFNQGSLHAHPLVQSRQGTAIAGFANQQTQGQTHQPRILNAQDRVIQETVMRWTGSNGNMILDHASDLATLRNFQNVHLALQQELVLSSGQGILSDGDRDNYSKRLMLLEKEISGLMKRKIDVSHPGDNGRVLDYTVILNDKETQVVELEKKINNLEDRLRRANARQAELENQIVAMYAEHKRKDQLIQARNEIILAEVSAANSYKQTVNRLRRNMEMNRSKLGQLERALMDGVVFPEVGSFEIKADLLTKDGAASRSNAYQNLPQEKKYKTQLIQFFRQCERLCSADGLLDTEIEKALEGFLLNLNGSKIRQSVQQAIDRNKMQADYTRLKDQFGVAVGIFQKALSQSRQQGLNTNVQLDPTILDLLNTHKINVLRLADGTVNLERFSERVIEVPVQDARVKHLVHLLAVELKRLLTKYPKLLDEIPKSLQEFLQQEIIDQIETDSIDRLVEIVKYVPQVVKVQNVYAYSNEKSRKVEFHLRVLIKALLEELEKVKARTGVALQLDEGVVGMINQEIMGVVNVDDILKVFRVVPKIVEVEKIVEKIVERIVEVPQVVTVEKIVEKIIEIEKIREVEKIVNVPLEVPSIVVNIVEKIVPVEHYIEKIVEVPQIVEKIVEVIIERPTVVEVEKIVERIVEVEKIIQVNHTNNHIQPEIKTVEIYIEKLVPVETIVEKIVEVQVIVEKIVEKIVQVPQIIEVERIVEKMVPQIQYRNAKEIEHHIEVQHKIVDRIVQKPVYIERIVERLIEVPQIVQKIVELTRTVVEIREVEVIREKMVISQVVKEVQVYVDRPIVTKSQIIKEVERIVRVPVIHEKIVTVVQIVEKPIIQRVTNTVIKEVYLRDPLIVREPKIIEVIEYVNHYIEVPKPVKYIEEKIVEVIRHVDRIKEVKVPVEKIIEKMVEVPRVVEVQRIVEKIVVVPRIIEKIIQVPQIVEKIVPKVIIEERIKEVERIVQVPVFQERPFQVEVSKTVFVQVPQIVERIVDKMVEVPHYEEKVITTEVMIERVVETIRQIPVNMEVEKIVPQLIQVPQIVEITKEIIVPIQVPLPVDIIREKIVTAVEVQQRLVQIPSIIEKIVPLINEQIRVEEVTRVEERIVVDTKVMEVIKQVPYISTKLVEVPVIQEKIVPIRSVVEEIKIAQQIIEKVVTKSTTIPKIYEVERIHEKLVEVPKIVQVERLIPQLINVNRYIQTIVERIVEVPYIVQEVKQIIRETQRIVTLVDRQEIVKEVDRTVQKTVVMEKFKQIVRNINHIEKVLQVVERLEQIPVDIVAYEERLVEVPYILEKIVQKIVIMPQIVQVLKYVHEVVEQQSLGMAVGVDVAIHEKKFRELNVNLKSTLETLKTELRKTKSSQATTKPTIDVIEKFLIEFEQNYMFPKIVEKLREKVVDRVQQKQKIVRVPMQDERSVRMELSLSLLVEKLIAELKRLKQEKPDLKFQLEDDVKLIFFSELGQNTKIVSQGFNLQLKSFCDSVIRRFEASGAWSLDQQVMLNSFLQQRFMMANLVKNANLEIEKIKSLTSQSQGTLGALRNDLNRLRGQCLQLRTNAMQTNGQDLRGLMLAFCQTFEAICMGRLGVELTMPLMELEISDQRISSLLRQKDAEIYGLRDRLFAIEKVKSSGSGNRALEQTIQVYQEQNAKMKNQISLLRAQRGSVELINSYKEQIHSLQQRIMVLEQQKSDLSASLVNLNNECNVKINFYEGQGQFRKGDIENFQLKSAQKTQRRDIDVRSPDYVRNIAAQFQATGDSKGGFSTTANRTDGQYSGAKVDEFRGVNNSGSMSNNSRAQVNTIAQSSSSRQTAQFSGGVNNSSSTMANQAMGANIQGNIASNATTTMNNQRNITNSINNISTPLSSKQQQNASTIQGTNNYQSYTQGSPYEAFSQNVSGNNYQPYQSSLGGQSSQLSMSGHSNRSGTINHSGSIGSSNLQMTQSITQVNQTYGSTIGASGINVGAIGSTVGVSGSTVGASGTIGSSNYSVVQQRPTSNLSGGSNQSGFNQISMVNTQGSTISTTQGTTQNTSTLSGSTTANPTQYTTNNYINRQLPPKQ